MRNRLGGAVFTLVELLVVIVVIVILLSLFLPALMEAKEEAKRAMCVNNQRQTGMGLSLYSEDHNEWLPYVWSYHLQTALHVWHAWDVPGSYYHRPNGLGLLYFNHYINATFPIVPQENNAYATTESILCPSAESPFAYFMPNSEKGGPTYPGGFGTRTFKFPKEGREYWYAGGWYPWRNMLACYARWYGTGSTDTHRNRGVNVLSNDGHVRWFNNPDYPKWPGPWYDPHGQYIYGNASAHSMFWVYINTTRRTF